MNQQPPSPAQDASAQAVLVQWQQWFDDVEQLFDHEQAALEQQRQQTMSQLKDAGLDSTQAIQDAWTGLEADERESLLREDLEGERARVADTPSRPTRRRNFL